MARMFDTRAGYSVSTITAAADIIAALLDYDADARMTAADRRAREHARRWLLEVDGREDVGLWPLEV